MSTTKKATSKKAKTTKAKKTSASPRQKPAAKRTAPAKPTTRPRDPNAPAVGTTLKRQFRGQDVAVKVTADGYLLDGQTFRSLTAAARHLTGYAISGPVFFKLVEPKAATKPEA